MQTQASAIAGPGPTAKTLPEGQTLEMMKLLVDSVRDYAIILIGTDGRVLTWNAAAQNLKGWAPGEIIGQHFSLLYQPADVENGKPQMELDIAAREGVYEEEGWRVRKDGARFWASVVITALRDKAGTLRGYGKVTRDLTERRA